MTIIACSRGPFNSARQAAEGVRAGVKPVRGGPTGDLLCRTIVETPVNLTREQKELLQRFAETMEAGGKRHTPQQGSWLDGVKKFFEDMKF